tara:strand:+ start:21 stop:767 length:747 start_codon:yes stop_codon:yes gene_type:complete
MKTIIFNNFKKFKSLYLGISGGVDSALGFYLIAKHISENNLDTKLTIITAVEPQPLWSRNDKNVLKITSIIKNIFPNVNIQKNIINFLEGYNRQNRNKFPKVKKMRTMHRHIISNGDYDLGITFQSSFPKLNELKQNEDLYKSSLSVGPEDRTYTGNKIDTIRPDNAFRNKFGVNCNWWQPFLNFTKKDFAELYKQHNLMDSIFPYTASCTADSSLTNNFTKACQKCFWCKEKYWAFSMFDYPQAFNL